jgi:hypothetical protein
MCGKTKGLEEFAKSQRAKPDTAKCFKCIEMQLADEPMNEEKYEQPDTAFVAPDHSKGIYPEYWSSAASSTDTSSTYVSAILCDQSLEAVLTFTHRVKTTGTPSTATAGTSATSVVAETVVLLCLTTSVPCLSTVPPMRA